LQAQLVTKHGVGKYTDVGFGAQRHGGGAIERAIGPRQAEAVVPQATGGAGIGELVLAGGGADGYGAHRLPGGGVAAQAALHHKAAQEALVARGPGEGASGSGVEPGAEAGERGRQHGRPATAQVAEAAHPQYLAPPRHVATAVEGAGVLAPRHGKMHHRTGQDEVGQLLRVAQLVHRHRLKVNLGSDGRARTELKDGPVVELHVNFLHRKHDLAAGGKAAAVVSGGTAQHPVGQLGPHVEGHHVLVIIGDNIAGVGAAHFPVHTRLAAPGSHRPLKGSGRCRVRGEIGAEAKAEAAGGVQGHVVGALKQRANGAFYVGEGIGNDDGRGALRSQLVGSGDAHGAGAGRVAVTCGLPAASRGRHPHLNAGVGPGEVIGFAGLYASSSAIVGVFKFNKPTAAAAAEAVAVDGEHGPDSGRQASGRETGNDRGQGAALRGRPTHL